MAYDYRNPYAPKSSPTMPQSGSWAHNLGNPLGMNYQGSFTGTGGSTYQPPTQSGTYLQAPKPVMGSTYEPPAPSGGLVNMDIPTPQPFGQNTINTQTGNAYTNGGLVGNVNPPPMPEMQNPGQVGGYNPGGFQTQYGTLDNLQPYMNPYLDSIIERGNQNIMANASARGHLRSTGLDNQLGGWAADATARAYDDAWSRFAGDRGYMTDAYRDNRDFGSDNYWKTNAMNYGMFTDAKTDWRQDMQNWYNAMNGITNTGINASNQAGAIQTLLGSNLAGLFGNQGDVGAMGAIQQGNNNTGLVSGLLSALFGGMK